MSTDKAFKRISQCRTSIPRQAGWSFAAQRSLAKPDNWHFLQT